MCLHLPINVGDLMERKPATWRKHFRESFTIKTSGPAENTSSEMQQISLLRGLCEFAGGAADDSQREFDTKLSSNDNAEVLGNFFELKFDSSASMSAFG